MDPGRAGCGPGWRKGHLAADFASQVVQNLSYTSIRTGFPAISAPAQLAMAPALSQKRAPEPLAIPDRLYFKIGDVARICCVETFVLRFWETQFPQLKPSKSGTGQRLYRRRDVELAVKIKKLVHGEGYTIAGAKQVLEQEQRRPESPREVKPVPQSRLPLQEAASGQPLADVAAVIAKARAELREIASLLASSELQMPRRSSRVATVRVTSGSLFPL